MIDPIKAVRTWLLSQSSVTDIVVDRIYGGALPEVYDAERDGLAITINVRGGSPHEYIPLIEPSFQIECWGPQVQYMNVAALDRAIFDVLHGYNMLVVGDTMIKSSMQEVWGQPSTDPDTGWATCVSFYRMTMAPVSL